MSGRHRSRVQRTGHPLRLKILTGLAMVGACLAQFGVLAGAVASVIAVPIALALLARLQRKDVRPRIDESVPMALDLVAAGLRAGHTPADALAWAAAAAADGPDGCDAQRFAQVAAMLRAGHDPDAAWAAIRGGPFEEVARVSIRSASSGARLATAYEQLARRLRAENTAAALGRAHRASVLVMAPVGLCFLPAFVCLGIVPVLVGITRTVLTGLP